VQHDVRTRRGNQEVPPTSRGLGERFAVEPLERRLEGLEGGHVGRAGAFDDRPREALDEQFAQRFYFGILGHLEAFSKTLCRSVSRPGRGPVDAC
jgi:hypothetical protein